MKWPMVVEPGAGEALWFMGTLAIIKVDGSQTGGRYALFESVLPKHAAPPLHTHAEDETFFVLEGELTVWVDGQPQRCRPGSIMFAAGGTPHTFLVESDTARILVLSTPAGIEQFVRALSEPATELRIPDDDRYPDEATIETAFKTYGVNLCGPRPTADVQR